MAQVRNTIVLEPQQVPEGSGGGGTNDFNLLENRPKYDGVEMTSLTDIPNPVTAATQAVNEVLGPIVAEINANITTLETKLDKTVMTGLTVVTNPSTLEVELAESFINLFTDVTTNMNYPLPVASGTQAGVMNSATFNAVVQNAQNIEALKNASVAVSGLSEEPSDEELTAAWKEASGLSELISGARVWDLDNNCGYTYYANIDRWVVYQKGIEEGTTEISVWTNTSAGVAKGSTVDGQVFAEPDGTGSVNGWDALKTKVDNKVNKDELHGVAFSGDYNDLSNVPRIDNTVTKNSNNLITSGAIVDAMLQMIYPVGSIYLSVNDTSPAAFLGGTWERIKDTFVLAAGDKYEAGSTGGEDAHKLTQDECGTSAHTHPTGSHSHTYYRPYSTSDSHTLTTSQIPSHYHSFTGSSHSHSTGNGMHNAFLVTNSSTNIQLNTVQRAAASSGSWGYYVYASSYNGYGIEEMVGTGSASTSGSVGYTGGSGSHYHGISVYSTDTGSATGSTGVTTAADAKEAHNNMPPYTAVYMWRRTA